MEIVEYLKNEVIDKVIIHMKSDKSCIVWRGVINDKINTRTIKPIKMTGFRYFSLKLLIILA